jgi:monooxygenase
MPEHDREEIFAPAAELAAVRPATNLDVSSAPSNVMAFKRSADQTEFDVIIVGAELSGIGVAYHLQRNGLRKSFVILEARGAISGTWDRAPCK